MGVINIKDIRCPYFNQLPLKADYVKGEIKCIGCKKIIKIDLQDIEYLHWWKFKAMFKDLKEDNEMVKSMDYRAMDLSKIKDKEQKAYYKKMKDIYKIPTKLSKDEKEKLKEIEKNPFKLWKCMYN